MKSLNPNFGCLSSFEGLFLRESASTPWQSPLRTFIYYVSGPKRENSRLRQGKISGKKIPNPLLQTKVLKLGLNLGFWI
jgi:hypothetical protein